MSMFDSYQKPNDSFPDNRIMRFPTCPSFCKLAPVEGSKPYELYDAKNRLVGYYWRQGETVNLEFNIDGEVTVEDDAIVLTAVGEVPNQDGYIGQCAYNITDKKKWICTAIVEGNSVWELQPYFTQPETGKSIFVSVSDYLTDKKLEFTLYNFRHEVICSKLYDGTSQLLVTINKELSQELVKSVYYCSLAVVDDNIYDVIFSSQDCVLLVK